MGQMMCIIYIYRRVHTFTVCVSLETAIIVDISLLIWGCVWWGWVVFVLILNTVSHYATFEIKEKWYLKTDRMYLYFEVLCWNFGLLLPLLTAWTGQVNYFKEVIWNSIIQGQNVNACFLQKVLNRISLWDIFSLIYVI